MNPCPPPGHGTYADGFAPVARVFASQLQEGDEIGAGLAIYHQGRRVVDLWGGLADVALRRPWEQDTRIVVFSVTKGLTAMALAMLADRGKLEWDRPVASYWPGFAQGGKGDISVRTLFNHRAGLIGLEQALTLDHCVLPSLYPSLVRALERQRPSWEPGSDQGYHALTFGMYARELFERVAGESVGTFLRRELFDPLGADVSLGTPPSVDARVATLYPTKLVARLAKLVASAVVGSNTEQRVLRDVLSRGSMTRRAFFALRRGDLAEYNGVPMRRSEFASGSATGSADGVARAYLPFASGGAHDGRRYLRPEALFPLHARQGWSERDRVLHKPLGWSQGFLKEEATTFSPTRESFGHAGMGGALGWCDPVKQLTIGYVMNGLDWRIRSPRALALCRALYECEPVRDSGP